MTEAHRDLNISAADFDAFITGLTATPSKQTFGFFRQNLVMEYSHEMAVADQVNVDFTVYRIQTAITLYTLVMASLLFACTGYLLVKWLTYFTYLGLAAAPFFGAVPYLFVRHTRTKRFEKFEEQFPEAIDLMARALRVPFEHLGARIFPDMFSLSMAHKAFADDDLADPALRAPLAGKRVVCVMSGGNLDAAKLRRILQ